MRKSIIAYLSLISLLVLLVPFLTRGDIHGPNECCFLEHDLTDVDGGCESGIVVGAQHPKWCDVNGDGEEDSIDEYPLKWGTCCFLDSVYTISDWLFMAFAALAIIIFAIAGYFFLFSGGEPQKITKAQKFLLYGAVAVALVVLSKVIPAIIKAIVA
jgi:hypothetical protein